MVRPWPPDDDATIYLWSTIDPEIGGRFIDHPEGLSPSDGTFRMLSADFYSLAFSPDSQVLAAGTLGEVLLYALADTSAKPASLAVEKGTHVQVVAYSPDGKYLAAGGDNNIIYVWRMIDPKSAPVILEGAFRADSRSGLLTLQRNTRLRERGQDHPAMGLAGAQGGTAVAQWP